jgi:hypothetical protein
MLSRLEAVVAYGNMAVRRGYPAATAEALPPKFCSSLVLGAPIPDGDWSPNTGYSRPQVSRINVGSRDLMVLSGVDVTDLTESLPLNGHIGESNHELAIKNTSDAIGTLSKIDPSCASHVMDWMSAVVWLSYDASARFSQLTSSSFPALPHCAFVTEKATHHIPPNCIRDSGSTYFLAENLYHESLHLRLSAHFLLTECISPDYESTESEKIDIPWRGESWEPDRVVHAAYVYANILPLRVRAKEAGVVTEEIINPAIAAGIVALTHLSSRLHLCGCVFSEKSQDLLADIQQQIQQVLEHRG